MTIRVLVVDDSPLIRAVLCRAFKDAPDIEVVGEAANGRVGLEMAIELRPDVVTLDVLMPVMDGLQATEEIMRRCPTGIVVVARDGGDSHSLALEAMSRGAAEIFPKPAGGFDADSAHELIASVRRAAGRVAVSRLHPETHGTGTLAGASWGKTAPTRPTAMRILIVDDSPVVRSVLRDVLGREPDMEIVGEAGDGVSAVGLAAALRPDVVTMDLLLPLMNGNEAALRILRDGSCAVLMVAGDAGTSLSFPDDILSRGAVEVFCKPLGGFDGPTRRELVAAVRRLAQVASA